jgi:hypothetical protein
MLESWWECAARLPIGWSTIDSTHRPEERIMLKRFANYRKSFFTGGSKAAAPSEYKTSIEGLVRDVACPIQNHKSTATDFNLECAMACAKSGSPLIVLTKSGDIYFPISDQMPDPSQREKLMPFLGKYVRVSGTVFQRNGTRAIVIKDIKELPDVRLNTNAGGD